MIRRATCPLPDISADPARWVRRRRCRGARPELYGGQSSYNRAGTHFSESHIGMSLSLSFFGAAGIVTVSRYLLDDGNRRVLVDCGLFQGHKGLRERNWEPFPVDPSTIDAVLLTHAHIDHSGYLPALVRDGFRGRIYCSHASMELGEILLKDSAFLQEKDAANANRHGFSKHSPAKPLYGTVVIPAFAVGRVQALLYQLERLFASGRLANVPVFLDSPMAVNASELLCTRLEDHRLPANACIRACDIARYVRDVEESKALTHNPVPKVIISASGMATGGRVLHHLKRYAPERRNAVLFAGYQAAGTRGAAMVAGAESVKIHGEYVPVRAEVHNLSMLSAHADADEILKWLGGFKSAPQRTFISHGEPEASQALRERIESELGWTCSVPEHLERVVLA